MSRISRTHLNSRTRSLKTYKYSFGQIKSGWQRSWLETKRQSDGDSRHVVEKFEDCFAWMHQTNCQLKPKLKQNIDFENAYFQDAWVSNYKLGDIQKIALDTF